MRSVKCKVCSVEQATQHIWSGAPATQNDDGGLQSVAPATKNSTDLLKTMPNYCACHTKRLSTRLQTRENVGSALPDTQNDISVQPALTPSKRIGFAASPIDTAEPEENLDSGPDMLEHQNQHCVQDFLKFSHFVASRSPFPAIFLMNFKICYLKINVSCGASGNFQCISQNATPATEFAPCHRLTQPWQSDSQKTSHKTRLKCVKCCACHAKWRS